MTDASNLKFEQSTLGAFSCMCNTIKVLFKRELSISNSKVKFGYFWVLFRIIFSILIFTFLRILLGFEYREGLPIIIFLLSGFTSWFIIKDEITDCLSVTKNPSPILKFPQITPLDLMISKCLHSTFNNIFASILVITVLPLFNIYLNLVNIELFVFAIISSILIGFSFGVFFASLSCFYPIFQSLIPMLIRILFFISGVFISVDRFPHTLKSYLEYNPILSIIRALRLSVSEIFHVNNNINFSLVIGCIFVFLSIGLLIEKLSHRKLDND